MKSARGFILISQGYDSKLLVNSSFSVLSSLYLKEEFFCLVPFNAFRLMDLAAGLISHGYE